MKLRRREKKPLLMVGVITYITGASLFIFSKWVRVSSAIGEQHHLLEYWMRVFHSLTTYFVVIAFGYLVKGHILPSLRSKKRKRTLSGFGNTSLFLILIFTTIFILYGNEGLWTRSMSLTHSLVGLACPLFILFHSKKRAV
jgi:hypothetical protein